MNTGPDRPQKKLNWLRYTLGTLIVVVSFYFLLSRLIRDWHQIPFDRIRFQPGLLILSYLILLLFHFPLGAWGWQLLLAGLDARLPFGRALAILTVTQLGKYAPGKVWFTLGRMSFARREGVPEARSLASVVIETGFLLLAAVFLFAFAILLLPRTVVPRTIYYSFLLAPLTLLVTYPPILNRILKPLLRLFRQPLFELRISYPRLLLILGVYVLDWFVQGLGCFVLFNSFYPLPFSRLPILLGGYAISWILGFVILIAPAGLGIREGIYTYILKLVMPETVAIISALITRIWMSTAELAMALLCLPVLSRRLKDEKTDKHRR
ncbi:MAG: lysylphosphatidylglycerol synthase transmembrane domain-containing protein [candidate division WOR-3 bacterium]